MNSSLLKVGDNITIQYRDYESYNTMIQEIKKNGEIATIAPFEIKDLLALKPKCTVRISYAKADAQYEFDALVLKRYRSKGVPYLDFLPISEHRRIQRRQFYRLKITLDAYVRTQDTVNAVNTNEWIKMHTVDLSGEGVQLKSFAPVPDRTLLECMICLDENNVIQTNGEVLEVFEVSDELMPYRHRIHFYDIDNTRRDQIIRFIFEQQQQRRWKELNT
jgi:c-di-GMP-binding flagellar brake protein YcgR